MSDPAVRLQQIRQKVARWWQQHIKAGVAEMPQHVLVDFDWLLDQLAAVDQARPPVWQPIETLTDPDREVFLWCVPKTVDETYVDTSGRPIVSNHQPYLHRGKLKSWGALSKATHWMPLPDPPTGTGEPPA